VRLRSTNILMNHFTRSYVNGAVTCGGSASSLCDAAAV
jgi:hypothetical protein